MSTTERRENISRTTVEVDAYKWREYKELSFILMKICIDKFLLKKKTIPKKLLTDYKKAPADLKIQLVKGNLKGYIEDGGESLKKLIVFVYNEYKYETEGQKCIIENKENSFDNEEFSHFIKEKENAVCFTYNKNVEKFNWLSKENVGHQFKKFKSGIKCGDLTCNINNNNTHELGVGKFHSLCVQVLPLENNTIDAGSIHVFRYAISGCVYFFADRKNRDKMYEYLHK
tara:strand:- start:72 stop:758 length:687 start_codon:yes stop_codon:yes gene_type:complete